MNKRIRGAAGAGRTWPLPLVPQLERREAPHPYVTGVRAPDRNGARRTLARFARGASQAPRRLPALHFPCVQGRRKYGKGRRPAPEKQSTGRRKRWLFDK